MLPLRKLGSAKYEDESVESSPLGQPPPFPPSGEHSYGRKSRQQNYICWETKFWEISVHLVAFIVLGVAKLVGKLQSEILVDPKIRLFNFWFY